MKDNLSITEFIDNLLDEFRDVFSLEISCKLIVISALTSISKYKDIVCMLKDKLEEGWIINHPDYENAENILKLYLAPDHNKINRLRQKQYSSPQKLLSCIGCKNFIHAVLTKYPYPVIVGFPFFKWTSISMQKYIQLYFGISDISDLPEGNYIKNELNAYMREYPFFKKTSTLKGITNYYKKTMSCTHLFFLYTNKQTYKISNLDSQAKNLVERYNETCFYSLLDLEDEHSYPKRIYMRSYNNNAKYNLLRKIFNSIAKELSTTSTILILDRKLLKKELNIYYNDLKNIPNIHLLLFKNPDKLQKILKKAGFVKEALNLQTMSEKSHKIGNYKLEKYCDRDNFRLKLGDLLKKEKK